MGRPELADHVWDARRWRQRGIQLTAQGLQSNSLEKGVILLGMNGLKAAPLPLPPPRPPPTWFQGS